MSQHDAYLQRVAVRLDELEAEIKAISQRMTHENNAGQAQRVRDLEAGLAVAKQRLQAMRRAGSELNEEMTQSFAQSFERLSTAVGRAAAAAGDHHHAA